jgi:hypothetical protein
VPVCKKGPQTNNLIKKAREKEKQTKPKSKQQGGKD